MDVEVLNFYQEVAVWMAWLVWMPCQLFGRHRYSTLFDPAGFSCLYRPWRRDIAMTNDRLEKMLCHMRIQIPNIYPEIAVCMAPLAIRAASAFRFFPPAGSSCVNALGAQGFG